MERVRPAAPRTSESGLARFVRRAKEDALWLRIIDVPATLEARSYQADLSAVLEISDDALGGGTFTLTIHNGKARVAPASTWALTAHQHSRLQIVCAAMTIIC
jgi:predicted acetyltransferase